MGVLSIRSITGDGLKRNASLRLPRKPVEGIIDGMLEGGMTSSVLISGTSATDSDFAANTSLNRLFAGVAFTIDVPSELRAGLLTSELHVSLVYCISPL